MDSKSSSSIAFFLCVNLILFPILNGYVTCVEAQATASPPDPVGFKTCPRDVLKLKTCAKLLNGMIGGEDTSCCSFLGGLLNVEAAACLCTAIKAKVLGLDINIPISMRLIFNDCNKQIPSSFSCD